MGYVAKNLSNNEKIIHEGKIHWFVFVPWIILFIFCFSSIVDKESNLDEDDALIYLAFLALSFLAIIHSFFYKISTEFAITNRRIISKTGFISRSTIEFGLNKIESINVEQGIFGRIFGYGSVVINGTGGVKTPVKNIKNPLKFRLEAMNIIDQSHDSSSTDK